MKTKIYTQRIMAIFASLIAIISFARCDDGNEVTTSVWRKYPSTAKSIWRFKIVNEQGEKLLDPQKKLSEGGLGQDYIYLKINDIGVLPGADREKILWDSIPDLDSDIHNFFYGETDWSTFNTPLEDYDYPILLFDRNLHQKEHKLCLLLPIVFPSRTFEFDIVFPLSKKRIHFKIKHYTQYSEYRGITTAELSLSGDDVVSYQCDMSAYLDNWDKNQGEVTIVIK